MTTDVLKACLFFFFFNICKKKRREKFINNMRQMNWIPLSHLMYRTTFLKCTFLKTNWTSRNGILNLYKCRPKMYCVSFKIWKTTLSDVHIQYSIHLFSKVMPVFVTIDWEYSFISPATLQFSGEKDWLCVRLLDKGSLWIVLDFPCFHNL